MFFYYVKIAHGKADRVLDISSKKLADVGTKSLESLVSVQPIDPEDITKRMGLARITLIKSAFI